MKVSAPILAAALGIAPSLFAANPWHTDLPRALNQAKAEGKFAFVNFTGSDWCGWCIRLKREVLSTPVFESFASNNLVLVEVDFPKRKPITPAQRQANAALQQRFNIEGYPTLVILDATGKELGRLSYEPGGPRTFLNSLQKITRRARPPSAKSAERADASLSNAPSDPERTSWLPVNSPPPPPTSNLILKGVSGRPGRRVALINDRSLTAGEGAVIQLADRRVKVRCLKVGETSVVVKVDNHPDPVELKLRQGL
jgi:protein disulfide-isomerase